MKQEAMIGIFAVVLVAVFGLAYVDVDDESNDFDPELPCIHIDVKGKEPILSKDYYLMCDVSVDNSDDSHCFEDLPANVRGRGNTSWSNEFFDMHKKPYKLKFDTPVDMLGLGKATEWALIANYSDYSLCRNYFAYNLADAIGLDFTPDLTPVHLYLNGIYEGIYMLTDQMEIGENRVDIDQDLTHLDTGYLIEMDGRAHRTGTESIDYCVVEGKMYSIKGLNTSVDDISHEHLQFVQNMLQNCFDALHSGDYSKVTDVMDEESFVKCYIIHELFNILDINWSSFFMYYDSNDGRLYCGPVWDFDSSAGNSRDESGSTDVMWAAKMNVWYSALLEYSEFRDLLAHELEDNHDLIEDTLSDLYDEIMDYEDDFEYNFVRWPMLSSIVWSNSVDFITMRSWGDHMDYLYNWLMESLDEMEKVYL